MANHKSAKKRIRSNENKRIVNKNAASRIRTVIKKALGSDEKAEAEKLYKEAVSVLDRSVTKGQIHKNTAARKKAALTKHFNNLEKAK